MAELHPGSTGPSRSADSAWRERLLLRRERLTRTPGVQQRPDFQTLLQQVDAALARLDDGTFGCCSRCDGHVETERLLGDPLARVCLECLSEQESRDLERDLELAAVIQSSLLPAPRLSSQGWTIAHRYLPLGPVSGDYYDVIPVDAERGTVHVVLGDVAGKGVAASMLTAGLHAMFRSLAPLGWPLEQLAARANRLFAESTLPNAYATLVLARLAADGTVELSNAGHCPPLVARDGRIEALPATGLPLGAFAEAHYDVHRLTLGEGDRLLLYTDGLSESEDGNGEAFGELRIEQSFSRDDGRAPQRDVESVLEAFGRFRGTSPRHDDLTLAAIRREHGQGGRASTVLV